MSDRSFSDPSRQLPPITGLSTAYPMQGFETPIPEPRDPRAPSDPNSRTTRREPHRHDPRS
jgi:hypothetical protein